MTGVSAASRIGRQGTRNSPARFGSARSAASTAAFISRAVAYRLSGSFCSARRTIFSTPSGSVTPYFFAGVGASTACART